MLIGDVDDDDADAAFHAHKLMYDSLIFDIRPNGLYFFI